MVACYRKGRQKDARDRAIKGGLKPPRVKGKFQWKVGNTRGELHNWLIQYQGQGGGSLPVIVGLTDQRNRKLRGQEFLYGDHAYFDRGWEKQHFRLIRNGHHQTQVFPRPDDRLKKWNVQIEPWRKDGRSIVVIPPSQYYFPIYPVREWLAETLRTLKTNTDRPIHVKYTKGRLRECLQEQDAFAVICCISVAGMESALAGYPVFSTEHCCSWPVNAGTDIERPEYPERHAWACSLAYASWHAEELERIDFRNYMYSTKEMA